MSKLTDRVNYIGWIPTVSGRLSFSEFGNSDYPTPCIRSVCTDGTQRVILAYQKRNLSDTTIPVLSRFEPIKKFIDKIFLNKDGTLWFCSTAFYDAQRNRIFGKVFVFTKDYWRAEAETLVRELMDQIPRFNGDVSRTESKALELEEQIGAYSATIVNYSIKRTGEIEINFKYSEQGKKYIDAFHDDVDDDIFNQIYYFLKGCLHRHQHHSKNTDSILQIYKKTGEIDWKVETLYTLYRKIINRRRSGKIVELSQSLGVLAYASSFEQIYTNHFRRRRNIVVYNKDELKQSIQSNIQAQRNLKSKLSLIVTDSIKSCVALASIMLASFALIALTGEKIEAKTSQLLIFLAHSFVEAPLLSFSYLFIALFLFFNFYHTKEIYKEIYHDTIRLCIAGGRKTQIFFFFLSVSMYTIALTVFYNVIT